LSPIASLEGIMFKCDFIGCKEKFKTRAEEISHEIHFHWGVPRGWGCEVCNAKTKK
jgi:hypothetical protein